MLDFRVGAIYNESVKRDDEMRLSGIKAPASAGVVREADEVATAGQLDIAAMRRVTDGVRNLIK